MSIYENLFDWQKNIIDGYQYKDSLGLFLDMGLGKTILSLALAEQSICHNVIVITVNSKAIETKEVPGSWFYWASKSEINWNQITKNDKIDPNKNNILLINYESLFERTDHKKQKNVLKQNVTEFIKACKNKRVAIIVDESHKLKNLQSQQTLSIFSIQKQLLKICSKVKTYLLTGTPFTTGYIDLYAQLKLLGCEMTKNDFVDKFCEKGNIKGLLGWQQPIVGYKNVDALFRLLKSYAITMKSEQVVDLPEKIFVNHKLSVSNEFNAFTKEKLYGSEIYDISQKLSSNVNKSITLNKAKQNNPFYRNIAYPDIKWLASTSGNFWLRSRQLSIGFQGNSEDAKWYDRRRLDALRSFLKENEDNYILFYNYTPELLEIYQICEELGYNIDVYCGEVKSEVFYEKYSNLSEAKKLTTKKNILLANFQSGSVAKNWQAYNKCIIFSFPLFKDWQQGLKRIHRVGQKSTVIYHLFYQTNWLDLGMRSAIEKCVDYDLKMFESNIIEINSK